MEDKINSLFDAIKPTNGYFSELVISQLVDDIIGSDSTKARLLLRDIDRKLEEFLREDLNSEIKDHLTIKRHWKDIKELCFLRISVESSNYKYNFLSQEWDGAWVPYKDNTNGLFPQLEPYSSNEWGLYSYLKEGKGFMPFRSLDDYLQRKWEEFRKCSPIFEPLDAVIQAKEMVDHHGPLSACVFRYGDGALRGYDIMTKCITKISQKLTSGNNKQGFEASNNYIDNYIRTTKKKRLKDTLHKYINGKTGRAAILPLYVAVNLKLMDKPKYNDFIEEFGSIIKESEYSKAMNRPKFDPTTVEKMERIFTPLKQ